MGSEVRILSSANFQILSMIIEAILSGPFATNAYIAGCPETMEAAIIDPAPESTSAIARALESHKLTPKKILLTHSHWDHIADVPQIKERYGIPVWVHEKDAPNLRKLGADGLPVFSPMPPVEPDEFFREGDEIPVGNLRFAVIHTPGHTPGGVCFYEKKEGVLFSGDTLFQGSIGNLSFPSANPEDMWISLDKLKDLPPETKVYPGHGGSTTIKNESWLPEARRYFQ